MNKEICIQQKTGSCLGCPILEEALEEARLTRDNNVQDEKVRSIGSRLCPPGGDIAIPQTVRGRQGRIILFERR